MRFILIQVLLAAIAACSFADNGDSFDIVRNGKPMATVMCADGGSERLKRAIGILRDCIAESSGARLDLSATAPETGNVIYVGSGPWVEAFKVDQKGLDDDGFEILFPDARSVLILGPTDWGTEFGIYEFLERYVGVRWLIPGREGTHIPQQKAIKVPTVDVRQEPAFFERSWSGFTNNNRDQVAWMRTARMPWRYNRVSFHHSLQNLLPVATYGKTHPEFYPLIDGKRWRPGDGVWQPCFSAPGSAEEAARTIIKRFDGNPLIRTASLGINDGGSSSWCQCEACRAQYSGKDNSLGVPDYSDIYYAWCNKVIEIVLKKYPEALFGCLAYNNVFDPPSRVKVHPRLIPYICMDRMQWADPKRREHGHAFHQRWHKQCPTLGWYDYIYGKQYKLPRVYFHQMADNLRYALQNGVRAFYAEAYPPNDPNWGEGPKLYVTSRLLWNPDIDVDALLRDWYVSFAGKDAADDLAKYYQHWEDFWTQRVLKTRWFGDRDSPDYKKKQILDFYASGYLDIVTLQEMAQCRRWLESALAKAKTKPQKARVQFLLNAFERYEDAVLYYAANMSKRSPEEELASFLQGDIPEQQRRKAKELLDVLQGQVELVSKNPSFEAGDKAKPENWNLWWYRRSGVIEWIEGPEARTGKKCVRVKGIGRGGPVQQAPVKPGRYIMVISYMVPAEQKAHEVQMNVSLKELEGKNLGTDTYAVEPIPGQWRRAARSFVVPNQVGDSKVATVTFVPVINNMGPEETIYYDDVGVYRLPD